MPNKCLKTLSMAMREANRTKLGITVFDALCFWPIPWHPKICIGILHFQGVRKVNLFPLQERRCSSRKGFSGRPSSSGSCLVGTGRIVFLVSPASEVFHYFFCISFSDPVRVKTVCVSMAMDRYKQQNIIARWDW